MSTDRHRSRPEHLPDHLLKKTQKHTSCKRRARSRIWTQRSPELYGNDVIPESPPVAPEERPSAGPRHLRFSVTRITD